MARVWEYLPGPELVMGDWNKPSVSSPGAPCRIWVNRELWFDTSSGTSSRHKKQNRSGIFGRQTASFSCCWNCGWDWVIPSRFFLIFVDFQGSSAELWTFLLTLLLPISKADIVIKWFNKSPWETENYLLHWKTFLKKFWLLSQPAKIINQSQTVNAGRAFTKPCNPNLEMSSPKLFWWMRESCFMHT